MKRQRFPRPLLHQSLLVGAVMLVCVPSWCASGFLVGVAAIQVGHRGHATASTAARELVGAHAARVGHGDDSRCCQPAVSVLVVIDEVVLPQGVAECPVDGTPSITDAATCRTADQRGPPHGEATVLRC